MQMTTKTRDEFAEYSKAASISESLRSILRQQGPRIITREPRHLYIPRSPIPSPSFAHKSPMPHNGAAEEMLHVMSDAGLTPTVVFHNSCAAELYEHALRYEPSTHIVANGALAAMSGAKTGLSRGDRRVVRDPSTQGDIWWGKESPNAEMEARSFEINRERAVDYLNTLPRIYVVDGYAGWHPEARRKIRVVCGRPTHALYMSSILILPSDEELAEFGHPDFTIYNAGAFPANRHASFATSSTSVALSLALGEMVLLGTQYAGEMRKGLFSIMSHWLARQEVLALHASANVGARPGDPSALFLGLTGTGKSALCAGDSSCRVLADDVVGWGSAGICNLEGGCSAKAIGLRPELEPALAAAVGFGTLLENVVFDEESRAVDWDASAITENTRATFPMAALPNASVPCLAGHPANIIMLCCDAFGVLPPVSRLTTEQALYYFSSGYTAKAVATEEGVTTSKATFSACFCADFLLWHPGKHVAMLADRLSQLGTKTWLVNTGWMGGSSGVGSRLPLTTTRAAVAAILAGALDAVPCTAMPLFGLAVPAAVPGVPVEILQPRSSWVDGEAYDAALRHLATLFVRNYDEIADGGGHLPEELAAQIKAAGPQLGQE